MPQGSGQFAQRGNNMLKDRNWLKILVPQVIMVVMTLAIFFLCWYSGMKKEGAFFVVASAIALAIAARVALNISTVAAIGIAAVAVATAFAVVCNIVASAGITVTCVVFIVIIAVFTIFAIFDVVKEFKLSIFWLTASYVTEAIVIFLPIYFLSQLNS
ncbi:hypothetical protein HZB94_03205 [Candidatus Falkowbacteria bacterium]|nr:hypothetical protein [Candidatus Falkowbacteria bacterium]